MPVTGSLLGALVCKLTMDVCESELPGEVEDTGSTMVRCDGNGTGTDASRLGEVRKCCRCCEVDREILSGNGRAIRSISTLAFPWLDRVDLLECVDIGDSGRGV